MHTSHNPLQRPGYQPAPAPPPDDDFGSPFDVAYGVDDDAIGWLPQPLATTAAATPEPDTGADPVTRLLVGAAVIAIAALIGIGMVMLASQQAQPAGDAQQPAAPAQMAPRGASG